MPDLISALQAELVVLEGEDTCLAAAGDAPGGMGVWTPADARRGGGGGPRPARQHRLQQHGATAPRSASPAAAAAAPSPRDPPSPVSRAALTSPSAPSLFQTLNLNQGYEQGLGAKLGQAFAAGRRRRQLAPRGAAVTRAGGGRARASPPPPSPGNRMDDD